MLNANLSSIQMVCQSFPRLLFMAKYRDLSYHNVVLKWNNHEFGTSIGVGVLVEAGQICFDLSVAAMDGFKADFFNF